MLQGQKVMGYDPQTLPSQKIHPWDNPQGSLLRLKVLLVSLLLSFYEKFSNSIQTRLHYQYCIIDLMYQLETDYRCGFWCSSFLWDYRCRFGIARFQAFSTYLDLASAGLQKCHVPKSTSTICFQLIHKVTDAILIMQTCLN